MVHALQIPIDTDRNEIYKTVIPQIVSLIEDEPDLIANLANISAALHAALQFHWVGFYLRKGSDLVLGPFQGPVACTRIAVAPTPRGVCGAAAVQKETILVPDVEQFPGHIACSSLSRSEIVVPLVFQGVTALVLDIDSEKLDDFTIDDQRELQYLIGVLKRKHFREDSDEQLQRGDTSV